MNRRAQGISHLGVFVHGDKSEKLSQTEAADLEQSDKWRIKFHGALGYLSLASGFS